MNIKKERLCLGIVFFVFFALLVAWMSGFFALPETVSDSMLKQWSDPGFLSFPLAVSILALILSIILIYSSFEKG